MKACLVQKYLYAHMYDDAVYMYTSHTTKCIVFDEWKTLSNTCLLLMAYFIVLRYSSMSSALNKNDLLVSCIAQAL